MSNRNELEHLEALLSPSETIAPNKPEYPEETNTWSASKNLQPCLVIRPTSIESLQEAVKFLAASSLEFQVKCAGVGNASAKDVVLSMRAFNGVEFDAESEVVYLGAGALWAEYYEQMAKIAPEYSVVACRTPFIGVGGSVLAGGFSWLSGDFGCTSDPENLLDAQVVKLDGSVVWASEEPDLLWGLRGAQAGLGIVTKYKLRARRTAPKIWGGMILVKATPSNELAIARGLFSMDRPIPNFSMFLYALSGMLSHVFGGNGEDMYVLHAHDRNGEAHGRALLHWAFELEGTIDHTQLLDMQGFANLQAPAAAGKGSAVAWTPSIILRRLTEEMILKTFEWRRKAKGLSDGLDQETYFLYEIFACNDSASPSASAWPRPQGSRHILLVNTGCAPNAPKHVYDQALGIAQNALREILGDEFSESRSTPNGLFEWHDLAAIYGENFSKLLDVRNKYDPHRRLPTLFDRYMT